MWSRRYVPSTLVGGNTLAASAWSRHGVQVFSCLELAEYPSGGDVGPQWHISVSARHGDGLRRVTDAELRMTLVAFRMVGSEEDNHHPGNARHFWLPVDPARRVDCECKTDEETVTEADGYTWTTPVDGPCRGCEFAAMEAGRTCPLHSMEPGDRP